jgi:4,5-dihydroxyphthalate decarboxylase
MPKLQLTLACAPYDRVRPIFDGRVAIDGCEVNLFPMEAEEAFARAYSTQDFDVTELSTSSHILTSARGEAPYIGVPAFVSRVFRHSAFYIRTDRGIRSPEDLRGKIVGVPEYQMTAALWARGILADEYGVKPADIIWRNGGLEQPGRRERTPISLPKEISLAPIGQDQTLSALLAAGELDAVISARAPSCFTQGNAKVARLFPDIRAAEEAYYRKTGMFPIMHLIGIRRALAEAHPWLAGSVFKAFLKAREIALAELKEVGVLYTMLPWLPDDVARAVAVMGPQLWPYGIAANRKEIDAMLRWSFEQGLSPRQPAIETVFATGTFEIPKI